MDGYIAVATNKPKYLEMALNLALSIKLWDKRPFCLLHDNSFEIPETYKQYFDFLVEIESEDLLVGCTNKLHLFKYSPFDRTMFIDADSLMVKGNIGLFWEELKKYHLTLPGKKATKGRLPGPHPDVKIIDTAQFIKKMNLPYLIEGNGGVLYFDKSPASKKVFGKMMHYYQNQRNENSWQFRDIKGQYADEPLLFTAMSFYGLEPFPKEFKGASLMFSTFQSENLQIDILKGVCSFTKLSEGKTVSPTICHFPGLKPRETYLRETRKLRQHFKLPVFKDFS